MAASNGGILNLSSATTTNSGTLRVGTGSTANLTNNFVSNAGSLIDAAHGTVNLQGITVTGTVTGTAGTLLNFGNSGGNNVNGATLSADLSLTNDSYLRIYNNVVSNGTINLSTTSNGIQLYNGAAGATLTNNGSLLGYGTV